MIAAHLSHTDNEGLHRIPQLPRARSAQAIRGLAKVRRALLAAIVPLALLLGLAAPTSVLGADAAVSITIHAPPVASIGSEVFVTATVRRADNASPLGLRLGLYLDGEFLSSSHADVAGNLDFRVSGKATATAGTFGLEARFDGARGLTPARTSATLKIRPAQVKISTVPAVVGIPITVGDESATTGDDGMATLDVSQVGTASLEAHLSLASDQPIRVSFTRWGDQVYDLKRNINVRGDATYVLGLRTAYRASVKFVDVAGTPVDASAISRARFTSSSGGELVLTSFDNVWWEAGTAVSRTGGLQPSSTLWRLTEVQMAGTNVVNQGQQAFSPTIGGVWTINLLLYDLVVRTEDALTGSSLPGTAELIFPDSTSRTVPLGADGAAHFIGLPRGSYIVKLKADGITPPTPIVLSRSQEATIRAISYVDLAAAGGIGLVVLFALVWIGRRRHLTWLIRVAEVPSGLVRRVPFGPASAVVRRRLPAAGSAVAHVRADLASIGSGRGAAALGFVQLLLRRIARGVVLLIELAARLSVGTARGIAGGVASVGAKSTAAAGTGGMDTDGGRTRARRAPPPEPVPSWPTPTHTEGLPVADPIITIPADRKPLVAHSEAKPTAGARSWFEALPEEEGPTHECRRCHRQVPDSARFCRSCGHLQA